MTLEWTTLDIPLGAGIDSKTNEKLLKPPACADLVDAVFPATGVAGYETRKGYDKIDTSTTLSAIDGFALREEELVVLGGNKAYSVSELPNSTDLVERGDILALGVTQETLDTQAVNQTQGQVIVHEGLQVHAWYDSGTSTVQYTVKDATTGATIVQDSSLANSTAPKLAKVENAILLFYINTSATSIRCTLIPTYAPTSPTDSELRSDAHADALFDVIEVGTALQSVYVVYKDDAPGLHALLVDSSASVTANQAVRASHATTCLAVSYSNYAFYCIAATATTVDVFSDNDYPTTFGGFTYDSFARANCINLAYAVELDPTKNDGDERHTVWAEFAGSSNQFNYVEMYDEVNYQSIEPTSATRTIRQCGIASSAFRTDDYQSLVHLSYDTTLQSQYLLVDRLGNVHAKSCVGIGAGHISDAHLPRVIDNTWAPVFRENLEIDVDPDVSPTAANVFAQKGLKKVAYDFSFKPQYVEYGRAAYIQSGVLWEYDGAQLVEQGFHVYPEGVASATSAGSMTAGDYSYRIYYEWTNARGERQRSTTAQVVTVTVGASEEVDLTIPSLTHSLKGTDVSIVVYRTEANPNILGGAPFYRVSSPDPTATGDNGYVANAPTSDTVPFTDSLSDAALVQKELDYLNTGELDNVAAPVGTVIAESKKRVWIAGCENENRAYYSKLNARGRDQLEFNDTLVVDIPEEGGPITAFGSLNFHTVVFKENSCYAVSGEGKNNLGAGFFNLPQVVSLDVGCVEPRSIVNVPQGILFKSNKGIWRLGHNLDMQYVGANVEAYNDQDVTRATVIPDENHVLFLTSSGSTLLYNYIIDQWSRFTNHAGTDAALWNGSYTYARTDGKLYRQGDNYSDDGTHYTMKFVTAPIGVKGVQGKQRIRHIRLLGEYYSAHTLRVGLRFNHEPSVSDIGTWDPADAITVSVYGTGDYGSGAYGGDGTPVYQARFNMPRQKCQTVQFEIDSTNTGGAGRAMSIQALQIEVGAKRGTGELAVDAGFSATGGSTE